MKQPIAGVAPAELGEVTVMTVWPSICCYPSGRFLGRLYAIRFPNVYIFRLGNLLALASIPHALALYFWRILPIFGTRYRLTNRRLIVQRGLQGVDEKWVELDRFDAIDIAVRSGQEWFHAGDLIFRQGDTETFRLLAVSRPEAFRHACLNARNGFTGVKEALEREAALV